MESAKLDSTIASLETSKNIWGNDDDCVELELEDSKSRTSGVSFG